MNKVRSDSLVERSPNERILVAIGPDSQAEQVVHAGKRLADGLGALWSVVYVETPALMRLSSAERNRRIDLLRLAESLGAETVTLDGPTAAEALLEYACTRKAARIVVGVPKRLGLGAWLRPSTTTALLRRARGLEVIVIAPQEAAAGLRSTRARMQPGISLAVRWDRYAWALGTSAITTAVAFAMYPYFASANIVMAYVLASTVASLRFGRGPAALAAVVNVVVFAYCFVPPRFTFSVADAQYIVTFAVMLIVTLTIADLMASVRQQTRVAGARERRTALLYAMSRELAATRSVSAMAEVAVRHVAEVFDCEATVLLPDAAGKLIYPAAAPLEGSFSGADLALAQRVLEIGRRAGLGSDTEPEAPALYLPLGEGQRLGVLAVLPRNRRRVLLPEQRHLLETFAAQLAIALERARLADAAESARIEVETEGLRNTLLASISHDLRTPLAVIAGAASTLAEQSRQLDEGTRRSLARSIEATARDMSGLVSNVLELMRLESGPVALRREWEALDDLVGGALARMEESLRERAVEIAIPGDLPALEVDAALIVQALVNLLDNVAKHTPSGTPVHITARAEGDEVLVTIDDQGPGLPAQRRERLFDKFQRGREEGTVVGVGLGLAICRAIAEAHGGHIRAGDAPGGGARFELRLPVKRRAA